MISHLRHVARSTRSSLVRSSSSSSRSATTAVPRSTVGASDRVRRFASSSAAAADEDNDMLRYDTIHELQRNACATYRDNELFGTYDEESGDFQWMTYGEFDERVAKCRAVLKDAGVREYSKVGLISNNRWEWAALASATYSLNGTVVPMYEQQNPSDWSYILNDSECDAVFCATQRVHDDLVREVLPSTPSVKEALCLDAPFGLDHSLATRLSAVDADSSVAPPSPDDLANLIYTSGTTGRPKGVELLHSNTVSNVKAVPSMVDVPRDFVRPNDRSLAFLPWAHSYGQTCELWVFMSFGAGMGVCRGVPSILDDLRLVQPTVLFSVPTLYKKVYDGVGNLVETSSPLKRRLLRRAFALARRRRDGSTPLGLFERAQFALLDDLVLAKVRDRFGGRLRLGFCAGAAVPREVLDFMDDVGIPVCEGYGLTETSPIIALNTPDNRRVGSVGKVLNGVSVAVLGEDGRPRSKEEEGEICCYGPNVMRGYHKNPQATDEVFATAPDGKSTMFRTGDLGRLSSDGFLSVTGRIKEQYKLENGKYVCPTPIEEAVGMSRFVSQVVLCGANRPHNVALLVLDWAAVRAELGIDDDRAEEDLVNDPAVRALVDREIHMSAAGKLKKFEIPRRWAVVAPFTAANNMLTPKMSVRRHVVVKTYEDVVEGLYRDDDDDDADDATTSKEDEDKVA